MAEKLLKCIFVLFFIHTIFIHSKCTAIDQGVRYKGSADLRLKHTIDVVNANFNVSYNATVDENNTKIFYYNYAFNYAQKWAIRVNADSPSANNNHPILFVVRQERGVTSWQIPMIYKSVYYYPEVGRTLCPLQNYAGQKSHNQSLYIDVSSQSPVPIPFNLITTQWINFLLDPLGEPTTLTVSPSEPVFIQYDFPEAVDVVLVHAMSDDMACAIVSIQDIQCPVFDLDFNVQFSGFYQTMSNQAGITITKEDFPSGSFYVVLVLKPNDFDCNAVELIVPSSKTKHEKSITLRVTPKITRDEYYIAIFGVLGVFTLFYIVSIIISVVCLINEYRNPKERSFLESPTEEAHEPLQNNSGTSYGTLSPRRNPFNSALKEPFDQESVGANSVEEEDDDDSFDETDVDMLVDADQEKDVFRTKTLLFVSDLARKKQKKLSKKSQLYTRNLLTIAIFYGVPVVQLVYTYQKVLHVTGNQDICYYNFLCSHPFNVFSDFNHVFSNVGYVLLGILFLGLVWRRDRIHKSASRVNPRLDKYFGIPRHFGLYYAMALALMMEGILSGSYHVCPNYSNFQFDTAFMYIIASLCMLKIYQSRHPDINANAYSACFTFAIILLIGVIGVFDGSVVFWIAFSVLHFLCCLLLSIQLYYIGRWKLNCGIFKRIYLILRNDLCKHFIRPMYPDRLVLLLIGNFVNWGLLSYGLVAHMRDFGTFLLAIFITNLLLYSMFYIIMKLRYKEKILPQPKIYIILATLTWGAAMYFFLQKSISWQQTPAQSRNRNRECLVLHFYDVHDIWHFLSSAALFFSFMVLLTLDDDLVYVPRDKIPVF